MRLPEPRHAIASLAAIIALSLAYDLLRMPVQVYDALGEILDAQQSPSVYASFVGSMRSVGYLRPLRIAQIKAFFDLSGGRYTWLVYRGFHALLLLAAFWLFIRALDVRSWDDWAAAVLALLVLTGLHTFLGTVRESFPINHFLEIVVCCLLVLNLARSRGGWPADLAAVAIFAAASLTLESGLLVWVVVAAAWLAGLRGISSRGAAAVTAMLALYLGIRFLYLDAGTPGLSERSAGFGFRVLDPPELEARFGANPLPFYLYNVVASMASVLLSEPQSGVLALTAVWNSGREVLPRYWIPVVSSVVTTALIVWAVAGRWRERRSTPWQQSDRYFAVFAAVLMANAGLSYAYTKDEIISVAGAFYALAVYPAARYAIRTAGAATIGRITAAVLCVVLAGTSTLWAVRSAGVHHVLRTQAFKHRNDWARLTDDRLRDAGSPEARRAAALVRKLQHDAIEMRVPNPNVRPRWMDRVWSE